MKKPTHRMKNKMASNQKKGEMEKGKTQKKSKREIIKKDRIRNQKHAKDVKNMWKQGYIVKNAIAGITMNVKTQRRNK